MDNISKKIIASFLMLTIIMAMVLPAMTFATDNEDIVESDAEELEATDLTDNEDIGESDAEELEVADPTEEDGAKDEKQEETKLEPTAENIKLNTKIIFSGDLYSTSACTKIKKANFFGKELKGYENQTALVVIKNLARKNSIYVSFIDADGKLRSGHIKLEQISAVLTGKYVDLDFSMEEGTKVTIKVNGEKYNVTSTTDVALLLGDNSIYGIKVGEKVTLLKDASEIELISANGTVGVNFSEKSAVSSGNVKIAGKFDVGGSAALGIIDNGVQISGDATFNGDNLAGGAVQITTEGIEVSELNVGEKEIETSGINSVISTVIEKVKEVFTSLLSKITGSSSGTSLTSIITGITSLFGNK